MDRITPDAPTIKVVVVGAGYAGVMATNRFLGSLSHDERRRTDVMVVNDRPVFVERIRLHELAAGSRSTVTLPLAGMLHHDARITIGSVESIDPGARTVRVATPLGQVGLSYDYLIYAVGSRAATPLVGAADHAFLLGDYESAARVPDAIAAAGPAPRIAVVGGGLTGVEAAAELAEQHRDAEVTLFCSGALVPQMRPAARRTLTRTLIGLGVMLEEDSPVAEIEAGKLHLGNGRLQAFDVCLLAASFEVPDLAAISGLAVDPDGRLQVDECLRSVTDPTVIGAGDAIVAPAAVGSHLRMGCAVALPLGAHAADTLLASLRGGEPTQISVGYVLQCISLGRRRGYIQPVRPDDSPRNAHLGGRAAARLKEKICEMVVDAPLKARTKPRAYSWPAGPRPGSTRSELREHR